MEREMSQEEINETMIKITKKTGIASYLRMKNIEFGKKPCLIFFFNNCYHTICSEVFQ